MKISGFSKIKSIYSNQRSTQFNWQSSADSHGRLVRFHSKEKRARQGMVQTHEVGKRQDLSGTIIHPNLRRFLLRQW